MSQQDADCSHRSQQRCPSTLGRPSAVPMTSMVQSRGGHLMQLAQRAFPSVPVAACSHAPSRCQRRRGSMFAERGRGGPVRIHRADREEDGRSPDLAVPCPRGSRCDPISVLKAIRPLVSYNKVPFWFKLRKLGFCHWLPK